MCGLAKAQVDGRVCGMCGGRASENRTKNARLQVGARVVSERGEARGALVASSCQLQAVDVDVCVLLCAVCVEGGVVISAEHKSAWVWETESSLTEN